MASINEPSVVKFAFTNFTVLNENKWTAKCSHCSETIKETRGTSSGFTKHLERKHAAVYERYKNSKGMLFPDKGYRVVIRSAALVENYSLT